MKSVRKYHGECNIKFDYGDSFESEYELLFSQGNIYLRCKLDILNQRFTRLINQFNQRRIINASLDGSILEPCGKIEANRLVLSTLDIQIDKNKQNSYAVFRSFYPVRMTFSDIQQDDIVELHYGLTNFLFNGCEWCLKGNIKTRDKFSVIINGNTFEFRQLDNYKFISEELKKRKDVRITSELIIRTQWRDIKQIESKVNDVLILLSLAQGNWITYLYKDIYKEQNLVKTELIPGKTMPFRKCPPLIDAKHFESCDTKTFLETTFPRYQELKDDLGLNIVIEYSIISKMAPFLEIKYLLGAITFECITSYLSDYFKKLKKYVNLSTLRSKILALLSHFDVTYKEKELEDFIKYRDKLVHTGRFPSDVNPLEAWIKLQNFIDRTLLTILGYKGKPYINSAKGFVKELLI